MRVPCNDAGTWPDSEFDCSILQWSTQCTECGQTNKYSNGWTSWAGIEPVNWLEAILKKNRWTRACAAATNSLQQNEGEKQVEDMVVTDKVRKSVSRPSSVGSVPEIWFRERYLQRVKQTKSNIQNEHISKISELTNGGRYRSWKLIVAQFHALQREQLQHFRERAGEHVVRQVQPCQQRQLCKRIWQWPRESAARYRSV